ncbi:FYB1 protein, partial [Bucco capensis]|nr:FYB1 protein [Bucco capensis]
MEKFAKKSRSQEDVSGNSQPFKAPRHTIHPGLQAKIELFEKTANPRNVSSSSGPSTSQKSVLPKVSPIVTSSTDDKTQKDPKPFKSETVKFGVQLQPANREHYEESGCSMFPTSGLAKENPKPWSTKATCSKFLKFGPHEKEKNPLETKPKSSFPPQNSEAKSAFSEETKVREELMSGIQANEPKPPSFEPPFAKKLSISHEVSHSEETSSKNIFLKEELSSGPRSNTLSFTAAQEINETNKRAAEACFSNIALKPTSHHSNLPQTTSKNVDKKTEEREYISAEHIFLEKPIQEESSSSCHKFCKMDTVLEAGRPSGGSQEKEDGDQTPGILAWNALTPLGKLGLPQQKPSRPPRVGLAKFKKMNPKDSPQKQMAPFSAALSQYETPPHSTTEHPPPASHPSMQALAAPSLPPRNIKPSSEIKSPDNEENYDDIEFISLESVGEMYEDVSDIRSSGKKRKMWDKEEKRRMDQEEKEQKEKEEEKQEIRKKFKLTGPIQVLHQARTCADHKGGENELTVRQGDEIEIIRLTDNPEGKWLGRIKGCYGYIKPTMVKIDYDSLKRKQHQSTSIAVKHLENDQEMYDDVGDQDSVRSQRNKNGFWNPASTSTVTIYNLIIVCILQRSVSQDEDKNDVWSWGILKRLKVKGVKKKSLREKTTKVNGAEHNGDLLMYSSAGQLGKDHGDDAVYDDVGSSEFRPSPPELKKVKMQILGKCKPGEKDTQKCKNIERDEEEFRKKFGFEGEIKVLYSATAAQDFPQRRWGSRYLNLKPGEPVDIIERTDATKVLCRTGEGK